MSYSAPSSLYSSPNRPTQRPPDPKPAVKTNKYIQVTDGRSNGIEQAIIDWAKSRVGAWFSADTDFIVAGSSVLSEYERQLNRREFVPGDIDLYFPTKSGRNHALKEMSGRNKCTVWYESSQSLRLENEDSMQFFDFVKRTFGDAPSLLESFDFHIVSLAVQRIAGVYTFVCTEEFNDDIETGVVRINNVGRHELHGLYNTMKRLYKYVARGYRIDDDATVEVMKAIAQLNSSAFNNTSSSSVINQKYVGSSTSSSGFPSII